MKNANKIILATVLSLFILYGCEKEFINKSDITVKSLKTVDSVKFNTSIIPIFSNCTACHGNGGITP